LVRVVNDLNTCMELGSKSVLLSLDISASFDTIDTITVWAGVSLVSFNRASQTDHAMWPSEISGLTSGAAILAFPQESVLGPVLFSAFVSPISRIMEFHRIRLQPGIINTRTIFNYTDVAPWFHPKWRLSHDVCRI